MKISIVTTGRFHVCDLARELDALGHEVSFVSCVPRRITRRFGLPDHCNRGLFFPLAPLFYLFRRSQTTAFRSQTERLFHTTFDRLAASRIPQCDVLIGMSGIATHALRAVRRRFGASIWIERGSRHILSQKRIMEQLPTPVMLSDFTVGRELLDYDAADTLVVPSRHVSESFAEYGVAKSKLFQNPYGVDLRMFPPTAVSGDTPPTILSVGTWCYRKGCDQLLAAWRLLPGVRLLHVGAVGDLALPSDPGFLHVDPVPQWQLSNFYAQAHVFALPSREEGLAVVQAQALASGLHLVCSGFSGGEDYSGLFPGSNRIRVCSMDAPQELAHLLQLSLADAQLETGVRESSAQMRAHLSWSAYGKRYSEELALRVTRN